MKRFRIVWKKIYHWIKSSGIVGRGLNIYESHAPARTRQKSKIVLRDLIIVFLVFSMAFVFSSVLDLHESFEAASLQMKDSPFQYDEIIVALAILAAALSVFAIRRWRELETEIAGRIQVEQALVDSEERYRTLAEAAQDLIFIVNREGQIQFVNSYAARKLGGRAEKFIGKSLETVFPHEMAELQDRELKKVFADGEPLHVENNANFDGEDAWLSTSLVPIRDENGKFENVLGIAREITKRKLAEDALQQTKDGLEVMVMKRTHELDSVNQRLTLELDEKKLAEERMQAVNRALRTAMAVNQALTSAVGEPELLREICQAVVDVGGYRFAWVGFAARDDEKTVRPVASAGYEEGYLDSVIVTWDDASIIGAGPVGKSIRSGAPSVVRDVLIDEAFAPWRADAIERGYASTVSLPLSSNGEIFGSLNIYAAEPDAFDAEEVKLLSELASDLSYGISALRTRGERDEQAVALRRSGEQLSLLLQSLPIIFYTSRANDDFGVTYVSDNVTTFTGYTPEEVTTDSAFWMDHIHPDDAPRAFEELPKVFDRGYHEYEYRWRSTDGSYKWFLDIMRLVKAANGEEDYIVGMWLDITARKQGEERLLQVKDRLEDETRVKTVELSETCKRLEATVKELERHRHQTGLFYQMDELLQNCLTADEAYTVFARFAGKLVETDSGTLYMLDKKEHRYKAAVTWGEAPAESEFGPSDCWSLRMGQTHVYTGVEDNMICSHASSKSPYLCVPVRAAGATFGVMVLQIGGGGELDEKKIPEIKELAATLAAHIGMSVNNLISRRELGEPGGYGQEGKKLRSL